MVYNRRNIETQLNDDTRTYLGIIIHISSSSQRKMAVPVLSPMQIIVFSLKATASTLDGHDWSGGGSGGFAESLLDCSNCCG